MFEMSGFESGPVAVALTGAVLGWVLRPVFLRYRPAFFVAIAAIAILATLYGLSSGEARAVNDTPAVSPAPPRVAAQSAVPIDSPFDAHALCAQAREIARTNGGSLAGEPARLIERAVALEPADPAVREMAANAAFDEGDYARAIGEWQSIAALLPPQSPQRQGVEGSIARARLMADAAR